MTNAANGAESALELVCFMLAGEEYAVDINRVQEVIKVPKITPVPQMPDFVLGAINIRGSIVSVFDLRKRFNLAEKAADAQSKLLVLNTGGALFAVIVDSVRENIKLDADAVDPAPEVKMNMSRACIRGLGQLGSRMLIILDAGAVNESIRTGIGLA
jgi:purine-binding chemotaxis protein CheW